MGRTRFSSHQVTQSSAASRMVLSIILSALDQYGPDLQSPFGEACQCPMVKCAKNHRFRAPIDLITHLRVCVETKAGDVKCSTCEVIHTMKKKKQTQQLLKSPVTAIQRRWSMHKNARRGSSPIPTPASARIHVQEAAVPVAQESAPESGVTSMPPQLHSEPLVELQDPDSYWQNIVEADAESEDQLRAQAPFSIQGCDNVSFQNMVQSPFSSSFACPSSVNQSWDGASQHSTLFDSPSVRDPTKQLSIGTMSLPSSNDSFHESQRVHDYEHHTNIQTKGMSIGECDLTTSPEDVGPSAQGKAPWQIPPQPSHEPVTANHLPNQYFAQANSSYIRRRSDPAPEAYTNQHRQGSHATMGRAPNHNHAVPVEEAHARGVFDARFGNSPFKSYSFPIPDAMLCDRLVEKPVAGEAGSFTGHDISHQHMPEGLPPKRRNALKLSNQHGPHRKAAITTASFDESGQPLRTKAQAVPTDEFKCNYPGCNYRPTGDITRNYRHHLERHKKRHNANETWHCPVQGCTTTVGGDRRDNILEHQRRKHPNITLDNVDFVVRPKRPLKRKASQGSSTQQAIPRAMHNRAFGAGRALSSSNDDAAAAAALGEQLGSARTADALRGISGETDFTVQQNLGGGGISAGEEGKDILSQSALSDMIYRQTRSALGVVPWEGGRGAHGGWTNWAQSGGQLHY